MAVFTVSNTNDIGAGSLRDAITQANATPGVADTINFTIPTGSTINLTSGELLITDAVSMNGDLDGNGTPDITINYVVGSTNGRPFTLNNAAGGSISITGLIIQGGNVANASAPAPYSAANFDISASTTAQISNCIIRNGDARYGNGGGILNAGVLTLTDSTITNNIATNGGGIYNTGTAMITRCTISGNQGVAGLNTGVGIYNTGTLAIGDSTISGHSGTSTTSAAGIYNSGNLSVTRNTITANVANANAGGIFNTGAGVINTIQGSIIAGNTGPSPDIGGAVSGTPSYNLIGDGTGMTGITNGANGNQVGTGATPINPNLFALANNGGLTQTHALRGTSTALNLGDPAFAPPPAVDQRGTGFVRVAQGRIDVGAFEAHPPVVGAGGATLAYTENQAATVIDNTYTTANIDRATLASATVSITGSFAAGEDVLGFVNTAFITGAYNAATGILTLTGTTTVANYQAALRSVTYRNTSENPSGLARTVTYTTNDGVLSSNSVTSTVNVTPVDDAPIVVAGSTLNYTENQAATVIAPALTVSDVDNTNLAGATIQITGNYANGEDVLAFTTVGGITGTFNAATGTLTLSGASSVANYQTALRSVTYQDTSENPSGAARTVTFIANDGTLTSTPVTSTVNVTPVNDAPVIVAGSTLNYTENQAATVIAPALTVSDADSANLAGATIQITGNYANGEDVLAFTTVGGIAGTFNAATGTLTLSGASSVANYQTALRSVTYQDTSENPSGAARTVTFVANDGTLTSTPVTSTVNVTPVDDAPVVVAGSTLNYTENDAATAIDPTITVSDVDSANLVGATVSITGNFATGEDVLGFTDTGTITGTYNAVTGILTLTGTDTVANYQAALQSVTYQDTSENPSALARTVTFIANDGTLTSTPVTSAVNVTPVNEAPVLVAGGTLNYTENQVATAVDSAITVSDVDSANLVGATVSITGNFATGEDVLGFTDTVSITGSYDAGTGILTLTGADTVANYQAALQGVTYQDTSENPSGLARTVTFIANDGALTSTPVTSTVNVTPVNDAPILVDNQLTVTEGSSVLVTSADILATDVDNTAGQLTITISNVQHGYFELVSAPGVPVTNFTQAQINANEIRFVHDGSDFAPTFDTSVSDGLLATTPAPGVITFIGLTNTPSNSATRSSTPTRSITPSESGTPSVIPTTSPVSRSTTGFRATTGRIDRTTSTTGKRHRIERPGTTGQDENSESSASRLTALPELSSTLLLSTVLAKLGSNTIETIVETGKRWWIGKEAITVISPTEHKQAQTSFERLEAHIDKLLNQEGLDEWYQYSLEDLKDELNMADKTRISLVQVKEWQAELGELEADYAPVQAHSALAAQQAYSNSFFKPVIQHAVLPEQPALPVAAPRQIAA